MELSNNILKAITEQLSDYQEGTTIRPVLIGYVETDAVNDDGLCQVRVTFPGNGITSLSLTKKYINERGLDAGKKVAFVEYTSTSGKQETEMVKISKP
jgi:ABC-type phosphate/phosphonate transport system substrate-binding protein